jgi:hypothetical protein
VNAITSNSLFVWLVVDGWCWFVLREKYCWLVANKPNEHGINYTANPFNIEERFV